MTASSRPPRVGGGRHGHDDDYSEQQRPEVRRQQPFTDEMRRSPGDCHPWLSTITQRPEPSRVSGGSSPKHLTRGAIPKCRRSLASRDTTRGSGAPGAVSRARGQSQKSRSGDGD
jgi:hypothetical protein